MFDVAKRDHATFAESADWIIVGAELIITFFEKQRTKYMAMLRKHTFRRSSSFYILCANLPALPFSKLEEFCNKNGEMQMAFL